MQQMVVDGQAVQCARLGLKYAYKPFFLSGEFPASFQFLMYGSTMAYICVYMTCTIAPYGPKPNYRSSISLHGRGYYTSTVEQ
jgi:hypothetical protein